MNDKLSTFYKEIESKFKFNLPKKSFYVIRIDGKSFSNYTKKGFDKPFDLHLTQTMQYTTLKLCEEVQGCILGYTQSDEISILFTDLKNQCSDIWFDGKVQKIASVSASIATATFNSLIDNKNPAYFDARVFELQRQDVINYFLWRQTDCFRNAIFQIGRSFYSNKELHKLNRVDILNKLRDEKNVTLNNYNPSNILGTFLVKEKHMYICEEHGEYTRNRFVNLNVDLKNNNNFLQLQIDNYFI